MNGGTRQREGQVFRSGFVAIVGAPNVGKSTLVNRLVDFKLSIVSPRPQTTRHIIRGVLTADAYQMVFLDTPGLMRRAADTLEERMVKRIGDAIADADVALVLAEPRAPGPIEERLAGELASRRQPAVLAFNKVDTLGGKGVPAEVETAYRGLYAFAEVVQVSALTGQGMEALLRALAERLPPGEPFFDAEEVTDRSERFLAGELVREAVFTTYSDEVPYETAVLVDEFREADLEHGGKDYIRVVLYVNRESQRGIVLGRGGQTLKQVGVQARQAIEEMLGRPVHLELWVKARPRWRKSVPFLKELEYY